MPLHAPMSTPRDGCKGEDVPMVLPVEKKGLLNRLLGRRVA